MEEIIEIIFSSKLGELPLSPSDGKVIWATKICPTCGCTKNLSKDCGLLACGYWNECKSAAYGIKVKSPCKALKQFGNLKYGRN